MLSAHVAYQRRSKAVSLSPKEKLDLVMIARDHWLNAEQAILAYVSAPLEK